MSVKSVAKRVPGMVWLNRRVLNVGRAYPRFVAVAGPNEETLSFIKTTDAQVIAELGVYRGSTTRKLAQWLDGRGMLYLFDFEDVVERVANRVKQDGYENVLTFGNSYKLLDSYNWSLLRLIETTPEPIFDYVFLDGAHTFAIDALAFYLIDRLLKPGGYIDFDDYEWTLAGSPSLNPSVFPATGRSYTQEQIDAPQMAILIDALVRRHPSYEEVVENKIFRKAS